MPLIFVLHMEGICSDICTVLLRWVGLQGCWHCLMIERQLLLHPECLQRKWPYGNKNEATKQSFQICVFCAKFKSSSCFQELGDRENKQENVEISLVLERQDGDVPEAPGAHVPRDELCEGWKDVKWKIPFWELVFTLNSLCSVQQFSPAVLRAAAGSHGGAWWKPGVAMPVSPSTCGWKKPICLWLMNFFSEWLWTEIMLRPLSSAKGFDRLWAILAKLCSLLAFKTCAVNSKSCLFAQNPMRTVFLLCVGDVCPTRVPETLALHWTHQAASVVGRPVSTKESSATGGSGMRCGAAWDVVEPGSL